MVLNEIKNLAKIPKVEGTTTILNQDPKTNKQLLLIKEAAMDKTMMEEEQTLLDSKAEQESRKITHNTAQCLGNKKKTVNDVNDDEEEQPHKDQEDTPHCDTVQSFFQAKN